jgi:sec-independent protein translocase protein TatA
MVGDLLQPTHLLFVLVVALLVLGPKRLPEVGRALGKGLRDFRGAISGEEPAEPTITQAAPSDASPGQPAVETEYPAPPSEPVAAGPAPTEPESHS